MSVLLVCHLLSFVLACPQEPTPAPAVVAKPTPQWKVLKTFAVGGEGSWDYVSVDPAARRLYVGRSTHVMVLDADTGKLIYDLADTQGVHGVAIATEFGRGFSSNGRANNLTAFELATGKKVGTIETGKNPDALTYEPTTKCVYVGNGRSNDVTVVSAEKMTVVATIAVGGKPEAIVVDGKGKVFVNIEDQSEVVRIDAKKNTVEHHFPLAPGEEPTGLAIDIEHHTLFAACGNEHLVVFDGETGSVLASPAIGKGTDGAAFDPVSGCAFSANGVGTLSVVQTRDGKPFTVVQTLETAAGARTLVFDPKSRQIYLPTAEYGEAPAADASGGRRQRRPMKPDSFKIVVVGL